MTLPRTLETEWMDSAAEAEAYDAMDHGAVNQQFVTDLLAAVAPLHPSAEPGEQAGPGEQGKPAENDWVNVLDLGTGTALIPIELCHRSPHCRVMAADAAISMLELARYRVEAAGLRERIVLSHVDGKQLPYDSGQFRIVISNSLVHHIPNPIDALQEAVRVLAPEGWLFFRDLLRPRDEQELRHLVETHAAHESALARQLFADSLRAALTIEEMRELIGSLGFARETVQATSDRHWTWQARKLAPCFH